MSISTILPRATVVLALLYLAGGAWIPLGMFEMVGAVLPVVPAGLLVGFVAYRRYTFRPTGQSAG